MTRWSGVARRSGALVIGLLILPVTAARATDLSSPPNSFRTPPPVQEIVGGYAPPRAACRPSQITARASTRRGPDGVLGVVQLRGAFIAKDTRCAMDFSHGPLALLDSHGHRLAVRLARGNPVNPASNNDGHIAVTWMAAGEFAWGFAWTDGYCGVRAASVLMRSSAKEPILAPLTGPQPECVHGPTVTSRLIDGASGGTTDPVQPAPVSFRRLRLTARFDGRTTSARAAAITATLSNHGTRGVVLIPCPEYAARGSGTAHNGGFSFPYPERFLGCIGHRVTIRPGESIDFRLPRASLDSGGPDGGRTGSTYSVTIQVAGVPDATVHTTVR